MRILFLFLFLLNFSENMNAQDYELFWNEEFDYSAKPDPDKWSFEEGFIRNLEEQYYTSRRKNVRLRNGKLEIIARRESFKNRNFKLDSTNYRLNKERAEYTSGSIETKGKFDFQYGRVEVKAKLPKGKGVWPAIWMLGVDFDELGWPATGEIDLMEHVGKVPGEIHGTVHFPSNHKNGYTSNGTTIILEDPAKNFHVYAIDWNEERIQFLVDKKVYRTFTLNEAGLENNPFRKAFFIKLNLALGGNWAGKIDDKILPQKFIIDYIRVYKKAGL